MPKINGTKIMARKRMILRRIESIHQIILTDTDKHNLKLYEATYHSIRGHRANAVFSENPPPISAESKGRQSSAKTTKAGQHFFQIPRHARGSRHARDKNLAQ